MTRFILSVVLSALVFAPLGAFDFEDAVRRCKHPVSTVADIPRDAVPALPVRGGLELFPLTDEYIAVAGLYGAYWDAGIRRHFHTRLTLADKLLAAGKLPKWSHRFFYLYATNEIMGESLPEIRDRFIAGDRFRVLVNGEPRAVSAHGYWINAVGCKYIPRATDPRITEQTASADLIPFAYLKLASPLRPGDRVEIVTPADEKASLVFDPVVTVSRAIKVNQVGYPADAPRKYAYLGMFLGDLGPMPVRQRFEGGDFHLRRVSDSAVVFTGKIAFRSGEQYVSSSGAAIPLTGEEVMELPFGAYTVPGRYFIEIPGVGRSWDFVIGPDAVGRAFYVQMRGLFHQRSGIEKGPPHTQWRMKKDHPVTYRGGFVTEERQYGTCFRDENGVPVTTNHFTMIAATATDEVLPDVYGGWWDAGDFDRRNYHFEVVDDLLSVYLLFPGNFSDGQLDIPESGNGIPDIIDEAAWGVDVWRRAQLTNPSGGVGCWIEATSHPLDPDPNTDRQRYYLALPTRGSSLQYAAYAAKLARAYRKCGAQDKADLFFRSAVRAWDFAADPKNRLVTSFTPKGKTKKLTYTEPENLPVEDLFKAAINLYLYDREEKYARVLDGLPFKKVLEIQKNVKTAYFLSELVENPDGAGFYTLAAQYRQLIRTMAREFMRSQEDLTYRNVNWRKNSPYFLFLSWGMGLPFRKGAWFVMAWAVDGEARYRDAALFCFDWMAGANPMGRSLTTGLGKVYPVRLLSLPMFAWRDTLQDPIPGLNVYTFSGMNNYQAAEMIFTVNAKARKDHAFSGVNVPMMSETMFGGKVPPRLSTAECYGKLHTLVPVWRRYACLEGWAVEQNEFTVWETIAPAAAAYGALLSPGWKPAPEWKDLKPVPRREDLPGYIFLP